MICIKVQPILASPSSSQILKRYQKDYKINIQEALLNKKTNPRLNNNNNNRNLYIALS